MAAPSADSVLVVVRNIPSGFHAADLRNYFSQFIETGGFICFHFKHRPETTIIKEPSSGNESTADSSKNSPPQVQSTPTTSMKRCCCLVKIANEKCDDFIKMYNRMNWINSSDDLLRAKCLVDKINLSEQIIQECPEDNTKEDGRNDLFHQEEGSKQRGGKCSRKGASRRWKKGTLSGLSELSPPSIMPQGNVGTPSDTFRQLIRQCRLPPRVIRKLHLTFPKTRGRRIYSDVQYSYRSTITASGRSNIEYVTTASGTQLGLYDDTQVKETADKKMMDRESDRQYQAEELSGTEDKSGKDDDDDTCEDWERYEALHDDVTSQERNTERLYENELEVVWEKGGSGLVFYTDAQYWDAMEGDFDERTAGDWDVEMSCYYEPGEGDRDAHQLLDMRKEKLIEGGILKTDSKSLSDFEQHTKGIGRKVMQKQGWKEGGSLGDSVTGPTNALEHRGQSSHCKQGLGYHGEKLNRFVKREKPEYLVSTIHDRDLTVDQSETLLRSADPHALKYRRDSKPS